MKYENANIKSKEELYHRLLDGEVFYVMQDCDIVKVYYDGYFDSSPFRIMYGSVGNSYPLKNLAYNYSDLCIARKTQWWESLPKEGMLVYAKGNTNNPRLVICVDKDIATTAIGTKLNVHNLVPIAPNDPRLFKGDI